MHYLVIDGRFGTPIYVFLEVDPRAAESYPGLGVREVAMELVSQSARATAMRFTIGRDPRHLDHFREFRSDGAAAGAGFILIEPAYVGPTWEAYSRSFRPEGEKPVKSHRPAARAQTGAVPRGRPVAGQ